MAERIASNVTVTPGSNTPVNIATLGNQIADLETMRTYRGRVGDVLVQPYWSQQDGKFVIPDNHTTTHLDVTPVWSGVTPISAAFDHFEVQATGDQAGAGQADSVAVNYLHIRHISGGWAIPYTVGISVALNGEEVGFQPGLVQKITVNTGTGTNTVLVQGVESGATVNVIGAGGTDSVVVGNNGSLAGVQGTVNVSNNAYGTTDLKIDDSQDAWGQDYTVTSSSVTGDWGQAEIHYGNGVKSLELDLGMGADLVDVESADPSYTPITIWAAFNDTLEGPAAGRVTWSIPYYWLYPSSTSSYLGW